MQIEVKGRNLPVTDELRECVSRRFEKVGKQVSDLAVLRWSLFEERNPANPTARWRRPHLKGVTLRKQREASRDSKHSINLISTNWPARSSATATSAASGEQRAAAGSSAPIESAGEAGPRLRQRPGALPDGALSGLYPLDA